MATDKSTTDKELKEFLAQLNKLAKEAGRAADAQEKSNLGLKKLFTTWDQQTQKMESIVNAIKSQSGAYLKSYASVSDAMEKAADNINISNSDMDKETKKAIANIKDSVKNSKLNDNLKIVADKVLQNVESYDKLKKIVNEAADDIKQLSKFEKTLGESTTDIISNLKELGIETEKAQKIVKDTREKKFREIKNRLNRDRIVALSAEEEIKLREKIEKKLGSFISKTDEVDDILKETKKVYISIVESGGKAASTLEALDKTTFAPLRKYVSESTQSFLENTKKVLTLTWGFNKLLDGIKQGYQEFVKLNSVGLAGTFWNLQASALKYQVSMEALMKISDQNRVIMYRDVINGSKSFAEAQSDFLDQSEKLSNQGLVARLGPEEGFKAAAEMIGTARKSGISKNDMDDVGSKLGKNFLQLNALLGTTGEQFNSEIKSLNELEASQLNLIGTNEEQRKALLLTNAELYRQGRLMGLSNAQIEQANQARSDALNPFKTDLKRRVLNEYVAPKLFAIQAKRAGFSDEDARALERKQEYNRKVLAKEKITKEDIDKASADETTIGNVLGKSFTKGIRDLGFYAFTGGMNTAAEGALPSALAASAPNAIKQAAGTAAGTALTSKEADDEKLRNKIAGATESGLQKGQESFQRVVALFESTWGKIATGLLAAAGALAMHWGAAAALKGAAAALTQAALRLGMRGGPVGGPSGKGKNLIKGGVGAVAGGLVGYGLDAASDKAKEAGHEKTGQALDAASNIATFAGTGAMIGSIIPGVGTAVGAGVGAAAGAAWSLYDYLSQDKTGEAAKASVPSDRNTGIKAINQPSSKQEFSKQNQALALQALRDQGITDPKQQAILMGQMAHESGNFTQMKELNPKNYEGHKGLGNTEPGDGQKFIGRGFIQLTGRSNYEAAGKALGIDLVNHPELAELPEYAAKIAAWYVTKRSGAAAAAASGDIPAVTKAIQGTSTDALSQRTAYASSYLAKIQGGTIGAPDSTAVTPPTQVATTTTVSPPTTPSAASINTNADMLIAKNIETSNKHLANISRGIEQLILSSNSGRVGTPLQKIPQNSTEAYKPG